MEEILPGVHHWTTKHPRIGIEVDSYWLDTGVAIDPLVPPQGIGWFAERPAPPQAVLLSNRHHYRQAGELAEEFGIPVLCNAAGLHEFTDGREVEGFEPGDELPGGVVAHVMGGICPDDTVLHIPSARAILIADALVSGSPHGSEVDVGFVPDSLWGDPQTEKAEVLDAVRRLLDEVDFQHLLLAHGGPVLDEGRKRLEAIAASGAPTAFEF